MGNLEKILEHVKRNNRVCPKPQKWQQLYEMLPNKKRKGVGWEPSLPLILSFYRKFWGLKAWPLSSPLATFKEI